MESIVKVVEGDSLDSPEKVTCAFCNNKSEQFFAITTRKIRTGILVKSFGACKEHLHKLNALLSGEFDIDEIFTERFRRTRKRRTIKIRGYPMMHIPGTSSKTKKKTCSFSGCTNIFYGVATRKYCKDPRCQEMRKLLASKKPRKKMHDKDADNLILKKRISSKIRKGTVLHLRCRAVDGDGKRCCNIYTTVFEPNCCVYPKYCKEHRTGHRRRQFLLKKEKDAKNSTTRNRRTY